MINDKFFHFCLVGAITFVIDYGLLYLLTEYLHCNYLLSSALAFTIAVIINYILCKKFVFQVQNKSKKAFLLFVFTSIIGLGINQLCMWFLVEFLFWHYLLAKILATMIVTGWNYITKKIVLEH